MSDNFESLAVYFDAAILELANDDPDIVVRARQKSLDAHGRVCLDAMCRNVLMETNPALLVTIEAAEPHLKTLTQNGYISEIPHIADIVDLARRDKATPRHIFQRAASLIGSAVSGSDATQRALAMAVSEQQRILALH